MCQRMDWAVAISSSRPTPFVFGVFTFFLLIGSEVLDYCYQQSKLYIIAVRAIEVLK
jgi:hypothetical protein